MKILAIESSCDETAAAVVENGRRVLSSVVATQVEEHKLYGGVVPEIASRRHSEAIVGVVREALERAELTVNDLDAIGVTYTPGLIGALLVGVNFAKGLSLSANLPLIPVHHLRSHIASNYITNPELEPPFLCLVVSGGHTHIIEVTDYTKLRILGKTRDDAAGEAFDKAPRAMGMPYPGGIAMDKLAETGNDKAFKLPRPTVDGAPLDFSFSGLKTAVINILHNAEQKGQTVNIADLSASYRKAVVDCLVRNFLHAADETGHKKLVIAGGVSANALLRRRLTEECKRTGRTLYMPDLSLTGDNAAMVRASSINPAFTITVGLCISGALTALSGGLLAQYQKSSDINVGTGMVTIALASLIIGETLVGKRTMLRRILGVVFGSCLYRFIVAVALRFNVPAAAMKLVSALIVAVAISMPAIRAKFAFEQRKHNARKEVH